MQSPPRDLCRQAHSDDARLSSSLPVLAVLSWQAGLTSRTILLVHSDLIVSGHQKRAIGRIRQRAVVVTDSENHQTRSLRHFVYSADSNRTLTTADVFSTQHQLHVMPVPCHRPAVSWIHSARPSSAPSTEEAASCPPHKQRTVA